MQAQHPHTGILEGRRAPPRARLAEGGITRCSTNSATKHATSSSSPPTQARTHHHNHLGTEHLLTGILAAGGPTGATLTSWGLTTHHIDSALDEIPAYPNTDSGCAGPPTATLKKALVQSLREASLLGHDTIGTDHLPLALLSDTTCTGTRILTHLTALDPHEMRDHLRYQLTDHPQRDA